MYHYDLTVFHTCCHLIPFLRHFLRILFSVKQRTYLLHSLVRIHLSLINYYSLFLLLKSSTLSVLADNLFQQYIHTKYLITAVIMLSLSTTLSSSSLTFVYYFTLVSHIPQHSQRINYPFTLLLSYGHDANHFQYLITTAFHHLSAL